MSNHPFKKAMTIQIQILKNSTRCVYSFYIVGPLGLFALPNKLFLHIFFLSSQIYSGILEGLVRLYVVVRKHKNKLRNSVIYKIRVLDFSVPLYSISPACVSVSGPFASVNLPRALCFPGTALHGTSRPIFTRCTHGAGTEIQVIRRFQPL